MKVKRWLQSVMLVVVMVAGLVSGVTVPTALAEEITCATDLKKSTPVLMVHGFNASGKMWDEGKSPMSYALGQVSDAKVVNHFDYSDSNHEWVTHENIGLKLAKTIRCLAQSSAKGGGRGKVIVVAHSMGGLATLEAMGKTIDGRKVSSDVDFFIAIAAPFTGSSLANGAAGALQNLCQTTVASINKTCWESAAIRGLAEGSDGIKNLPKLPPEVPTKVIAGNVAFHVPMFFATIHHETGGDLVVSEKSATHYSTNKGRGDGKKVFKCNTEIPIFGLSNASCHHNNLLTDSGVQAEVKRSIEQFLKSTKPATPKLAGHKLELFGKLTITYLDKWGGAMSEPGAIENIVDYTNCNASVAQCPHIRFVNMDSKEGQSEYAPDPVKKVTADCMFEQDENGHKPFEPAKLKGTVQVGGEPADYYEQQVCPPYLSDAKMYMWHVKARNVFVYAYGGDDAFGRLDLKSLQAVLAAAEWK